MYTPHAHPVALLMMLASMLCWGSWANTEKIDKTWRFELYYWDYMWGIVVFALLFGLTLGRDEPGGPGEFLSQSRQRERSLAEAFAGGMIFNLGNLLLVAAISVAGMAVAFRWARAALEHSNVELLTGAFVEHLETDPTGRVVTKVIVTPQSAVEEYSAHIVVVSCGAVNSAALLLRSANGKHPRGLANSSDVVGRHYMRHNCSAFMAISKDPNPTVFQKTLALK